MRVTSGLLNAKKKSNIYLAFFLFCLVLYFTSALFGRELFRPDEERILVVTNNITSLKTALLLQYEEYSFYDEKPPFYFWILWGLFKIPRVKPLTLIILFNCVVAWAIISLNYLFFAKEGLHNTGVLSSLILATAAIFYGMTVTIRMDILFLFFIVAAVFSFWWGVKDKRFSLFLLSAALSFLAVFTKGAFGIIFPFFIEMGLAIFTRDKKIFFKALLVNFLALGAVFLWLWGFTVFLDKNYFWRMFFRQTIDRAVSPHTHREGLFYYIPFIFLLFLPWSFLILGYFSTLKKRSLQMWERFFILWFLGGFLLLSLIKTKLPNYLLILSVPFAALCADFLLRKGRELMKKTLMFIPMFLLFAGSLGADIYYRTHKSFIPPFSEIIIILLGASLILMLRKKAAGHFKVAFVCWFIILECLNVYYLPFVSKTRNRNRENSKAEVAEQNEQ